MQKSLYLLATASATAFAQLPNTFRANDPAKADAVMANFRYLDSAVGAKADTAALRAVKASIPVGVNIGGKVDTAALTVRLAGYVPAATLSAYAKTSELSGYATAAALGAKADTSALNAVKASIPAGVNIGGKVDTAALTVRLAGYVPSSTLASYAKTSDLTGFATNSALANYAPLTSLTSYAKTTDLAAYATAASVNGKMNTADHVASGHLKALGGLTGGRGYNGLFDGSNITLDTMQLKMEAGDGAVILDRSGLHWGSGYSKWSMSLTPGGSFSLVSGNRLFDMSVLNIESSGAAQFSGDVKIDGALTLKTAAAIVPDYVFESDYKLAPLAEVEAFTQANKHLPEVPSAREIEAGGIDLAKMNLTLLKKVEELTLHAIAQEKQIKAQNERLQVLEARQAN